MNELSFYYTNKKGGNMYLLTQIEHRCGHDIAMIAWEACRNALDNHADIMTNLEFLTKLDMEYNVLDHLKNSWILKYFDKSQMRYSGEEYLEEKQKVSEHLQELLEDEANSYLVSIQNDYINQRRILKTKCFNGDDNRTNDFIKSLAHMQNNRNLTTLITDKIDVHDIETEFESLPQFVNTIKVFLNWGEDERRYQNLRRSLSYHIKVRERYGTPHE